MICTTSCEIKSGNRVFPIVKLSATRGITCACLAAGAAEAPPKTGGGMSAQRNFLATVLKTGKRQHPGPPQQVTILCPKCHCWADLKGRIVVLTYKLSLYCYIGADDVWC